MTMHMPFPARSQGAPAATPARVVALSERRAALFFDADAAAVPAGARLVALAGGQPFAGPVAATRLARRDGGERHVLIVAESAVALCATPVCIEAAGVPLARIDPLALQTPLVDPLALIAGLDEAGGQRLLRLLLTTGASLFGKGDLGGFGILVGRLVESLTAAVPLAAWCPVGRGAAVLSWRLPAGLDVPAPRDLCILHEGRARRFTDFTALGETAGGHGLLHLLLSRALPHGADLILLGDRPVRLAGPGSGAARPFRAWLDRRGPAVRARALDWLDTLAAGDAQVAALRDEVACPPEAAPRLAVPYLAETPAGLLYLVAVDDPRALLAAARLTVAGAAVELPLAALAWHPRHGTAAAGFVPVAGRSGGAASVAPVFRSGRVGAAIEAAVVPFDGAVPDAFAPLPEAVAAPALAAAVTSAMRARPVWRCRVATFGAMPAAPRTALVLAAGEWPEQLHAAVAALLAEGGGRAVEIVVHHADGPATEMVRRTAEALAAVHRIGIRVVSVAPQSFPSERLRAALAETRAPVALALAPGALPAAPGWLAAWRRRIGSGPQPRAVFAAVTGWNGAACAPGEAVGLNAAALARLVATRPLLPGVAADLAATPGLVRAVARTVRITLHAEDEDAPLSRASERLAQGGAL